MGLRTIAKCMAVFAGLTGGAAMVCLGQFGRTPAPGVDESPRAMMVVPPNRETLQALNHAREALKQNRTADAFQLLQRLIELPEDYFLDKSMEQTLKSETLRVLSGLTASERQAYELLQGTGARKLLEEARTAGQADRLAEIVRRYPLTQASFEAAELLAIEALDRGHVGLAAGQFAQLRQSPLVTQAQSQSLALREALAWHLAGQTQRAAELLLELTNGPVSFRAEVAGEAISKYASVEDAARWLAQATGPISESAQPEAGEWLSARGSASGSLPASATGPIGGPLWRFAPLEAVEAEANPPSLLPPGELLALRLAEAEAPLKEAERLPWSAATPLVVGDLMVFRTLRDVTALDCRTGAVRWRSVLTDAEFDQRWLQDVQTVNGPEFLAQYVRNRLFEDRTFGSLTSDGNLVFTLEGREAPAATAGNANNLRLFGMPGEPQSYRSSRLAAYEVRGGRLVWEIGGERQAAAGDFAGHYFLGPPVAGDGALFALAEVQGELRLLALEATADGVRKIWSQPLAAPMVKITESDERQQHPLLPACENGIVICPTGTGAVIAVDFTQRRLLWAYAYPSANGEGVAGMNGRPGVFGRMQPASPNGDETDAGWIDGNPLIAAGRVFLTPTDADELVCLNLADGKLLWKLPRERAVSLAGADGERALLIGPDQIDAVRATDGAPAWKNPVSIPAPTGRGVWMRDRYLVPLSTGEIATVDLARGRLLARSKLPDGQAPGNLAASSRYLVSLSARQALAFRGLAQTEELVAQKLAADPKDADALALRGEARLHRGEFETGLADLRASIALQPEPYVQSVLAAALLDVLRADFARYRDTVPELDQLTADPQQRREFLWLVARGLKDAGEPLAAFERMTPLIENAADEISMESSGGAWQARTDRRLAGLFASLYSQARPDDRQRMDAKIESHLAAADAADDGDVAAILQRHLHVFGFHPTAISARQRLAARLDPDENAAAYERELSRLAHSLDPNIAGPAAGKLARWFLSRKRVDEVDLWLAALESRLADVVCEADLTGKQLAEKLRTDGDYIESRQQYVPWPEGEITATRTNQPNQTGRMRHVLIVGPVPAHYQGWSFETDPQGTMLIARDESARHRWTWNRTHPVPAQQPFLVESPPGQHRVHLQGHLVGWSTGTAFQVAADLESPRTPPRLLWQETLLPPGVVGPASANRVMGLPQPRMLGRRRVLFNQPFAYNVPAGAGSLVALTDSAVIYHNGRRLFAADPLTGEVLWSRNDLSRSLLDVLADEETVAVSIQEGVEPAQVRLLRTIDGEPLGTAAPQKNGEWIGGGKVLTLEASAPAGDGPLTLQLHDVVRGEPIWKAELARPAAFRVWNQAEVFTIEANRKLTVRNLADGTIRWSQQLELDVAADALFVQRWKDRDLVIVGATPAQAANPRVIGFDPQHSPLFGYAAALRRETGELLWQTPINEPVTDPTAFDASQPAGWPALVFAGQLLSGPQPGAAVRPGFVPPVNQRLTLSIIDKETGKQKYAAEEQSNIAVYYVEVDPERNRMQVNFLSWAVDLHYTGKRRK